MYQHVIFAYPGSSLVVDQKESGSDLQCNLVKQLVHAQCLA